MNKPVSFEIAKLLKEKGFDITCNKCYAEERLINKNTGGDVFTGIYRLCNKSRFHKRYYSAPTIAEIVMWLYKKYGIWIEVKVPDMKGEYWSYSIHKPYRYGSLGNGDLYNSPIEAYEDAIEYILNNLI